MACWHPTPGFWRWWCRKGRPHRVKRPPSPPPSPRVRSRTRANLSRPGRTSWARLLKRVFKLDTRHCPNSGGGELKAIAAILKRLVVEKILTHLGLDPQPPPRGRARGAARLTPPGQRRQSQTPRHRLCCQLQPGRRCVACRLDADTPRGNPDVEAQCAASEPSAAGRITRRQRCSRQLPSQFHLSRTFHGLKGRLKFLRAGRAGPPSADISRAPATGRLRPTHQAQHPKVSDAKRPARTGSKLLGWKEAPFKCQG